MALIPHQPLELSCNIIFSNDARLRVVLFPLASHGREHPLDLLEGFVNGRRGDFFPIRTTDGKEMLVTLSECHIFELSREDEAMVLEKHPEMSQDSVLRQKIDVVSYALVSLTLQNSRAVRGSLWFHEYVPENSRNLMDHLNEGKRYVLIHSEKYSQLVRVDAVSRAQIFESEDTAIMQSKEVPQSARMESRLVDVDIDFAPTESWAEESASAGEAARSADFLKPDVDAKEIERVAKTTIFPRPSPRDLKP